MSTLPKVQHGPLCGMSYEQLGKLLWTLFDEKTCQLEERQAELTRKTAALLEAASVAATAAEIVGRDVKRALRIQRKYNR